MKRLKSGRVPNINHELIEIGQLERADPAPSAAATAVEVPVEVPTTGGGYPDAAGKHAECGCTCEAGVSEQEWELPFGPSDFLAEVTMTYRNRTTNLAEFMRENEDNLRHFFEALRLCEEWMKAEIHCGMLREVAFGNMYV